MFELHAADLIEYAARHDGQSGLPDVFASALVNAQAQPVRVVSMNKTNILEFMIPIHSQFFRVGRFYRNVFLSCIIKAGYLLPPKLKLALEID